MAVDRALLQDAEPFGERLRKGPRPREPGGGGEGALRRAAGRRPDLSAGRSDPGRARDRHRSAPRPGERGAPALRGSRQCSETRSEEHTSELQSLMRISYAVFCWKKKNKSR